MGTIVGGKGRAAGRGDPATRVTRSLHTISIIHHRIHDGDVLTAICVPPVRVLGRVLTLGETRDVNVVEDDVARIGHKVIVLGAVAQYKVRDDAILEAVDTHEHWSQGVDIGRVGVVPGLAVAVERTTCRRPMRVSFLLLSPICLSLESRSTSSRSGTFPV